MNDRLSGTLCRTVCIVVEFFINHQIKSNLFEDTIISVKQDFDCFASVLNTNNSNSLNTKLMTQYQDISSISILTFSC